MRTLIATWGDRAVGGAEIYIGRIMPLLADAGCEIGFGFEAEGPADRPRLAPPPGAPAFRIAGGGRDEAFSRLRAWRPDVIFSHGLLDPALEERLLDVAPSVLFAHTYHGTCISSAKTHRLPVVQPCDRLFGPACLALYFPRRCGGLSPISMWREYVKQERRHALLRRYAAVVTASEHMRRELMRHGAAGGRVFACPIVPDLPERSPGPPPRVTAATPDAPLRLLFAGRMDRLKGADRLLASLPAVQASTGRPIHVTLAGDGPERPALEAAAVDLRSPRMQAEFTGWIPSGAILSLLDRVDMFVMPSVWPEPYGLAGVEAVSRGVPVVAYAAGGIPEWLIDGENGCLAPADPPTGPGLAEAIVRCARRLARGELPGGRPGRTGRSPREHAAAIVDILRTAAGRPAVAAGEGAER